MEQFDIDLKEVQPSQLYICSDKLAAVEDRMAIDSIAALGPIPVKRLGSRIVFTDGHTRALAAFRQGYETIRVFWDDDELDWDAYQICVDWCLKQSIHWIADLQTRIVTNAEYEVLWLKKCQAMQARLRLMRTGN